METKRFGNWWFLVMNGAIFAVFGLLILFFTEEFIKTLLLYFGIVMLAIGAILLIAGINNLRRDKAGAMVLMEAIVAMAIGLALALFPETSVKLFLIMIGIWTIMIGILQLVILMGGRTVVKQKNVFLINAMLTVGLGVLLLFNPFQLGIFLVKVVGVLATLFGLLLIWLGLAVKRVPGT
jgi:uncharacterized membrane protein HdeD (DUF308 family)